MSNQGTGRTAGGFAPRGSAALTYSTFLGGTRSDVGNDIAVAGDGSVYVTGTTDSFDFPAQNPPPPSGPLASNVFVAKLSATTAANPTPTLLFATYLGGIGLDEGRGIALDCNDNVYVAGVTSSFDFPTTANAPQPDHAGGTDVEFPTDAFVAKLNASGSALLYATYLGGSNEEFANNIAVDASRLAYITGVTTSGDSRWCMPVTPRGRDPKRSWSRSARAQRGPRTFCTRHTSGAAAPTRAWPSRSMPATIRGSRGERLRWTSAIARGTSNDRD
jgi:hypothetical protein